MVTRPLIKALYLCKKFLITELISYLKRLYLDLCSICHFCYCYYCYRSLTTVFLTILWPYERLLASIANNIRVYRLTHNVHWMPLMSASYYHTQWVLVVVVWFRWSSRCLSWLVMVSSSVTVVSLRVCQSSAATPVMTRLYRSLSHRLTLQCPCWIDCCACY